MGIDCFTHVESAPPKKVKNPSERDEFDIKKNRQFAPRKEKEEVASA